MILCWYSATYSLADHCVQTQLLATSEMVTLGPSWCSCTTNPLTPDHWPCWLGLVGTAFHEHPEWSRFTKPDLYCLHIKPLPGHLCLVHCRWGKREMDMVDWDLMAKILFYEHGIATTNHLEGFVLLIIFIRGWQINRSTFRSSEPGKTVPTVPKAK